MKPANGIMHALNKCKGCKCLICRRGYRKKCDGTEKLKLTIVK